MVIESNQTVYNHLHSLESLQTISQIFRFALNFYQRAHELLEKYKSDGISQNYSNKLN